MAWSKVTYKGRKPIGWWFNKIMCEFWYSLGNYNLYHNHLQKMCNKYKFNLYGKKRT